MADADKNIVITPNVGQTTEPNIVFTGQDNTDITLTVLDYGGLSISGASGELFSIIDSAGGTIFSVNDISGVPSIEVDDDGTIRLAEFAGNVLLGTATDNGTDLLQVDGSISASSMSATTFTGALSGNASTASTLQTARTISLGGVLSGSASFNGGSNITITASHTSDPTITLTGAVTGSGTMTNLGNVSIATTATADPTLTLTGDVTGSATFTNLGNATLTATVANDSHTHDGRYYTESESLTNFFRRNSTNDVDVRLAAGDGRGLRFWDSNSYKIWMSAAGNATWGGRLDSTSDYNMYFRMTGGTNRGFVFQNSTTEVFQIESNGQTRQTGNAYVNTSQRVFADDYHPNADKWTTARTLSLSGDASGSVSWDGSANATLSVTVANDSHTHDGRYYTESEADSRFVNVTGDTISGTLTLSQDGQDVLNFSANDTNDARGISFNSRTALSADYNDGYLRLNQLSEFTNGVYSPGRIRADGGFTVGNNSTFVWHSGNDGSGSGLDADLLDGQQGSYYDQRQYTSSSNYLGGYYVSGGSEKPNNTVFGAGKLKIAMLSGSNLGFGGSWNDVLWMSTYTGGDVKASWAIVGDKYSDNVYVSRQNYDSTSWGTGHKLWHTGNDGSGSGLDADLLDGLQLHTGRNNEANKVVRTDGSGYIQAGWINTTSGSTSATIDRIYASYDGYIRYVTKAHLASQLAGNSLVIYNSAGTALKTIKGLI